MPARGWRLQQTILEMTMAEADTKRQRGRKPLKLTPGCQAGHSAAQKSTSRRAQSSSSCFCSHCTSPGVRSHCAPMTRSA